MSRIHAVPYDKIDITAPTMPHGGVLEVTNSSAPPTVPLMPMSRINLRGGKATSKKAVVMKKKAFYFDVNWIDFWRRKHDVGWCSRQRGPGRRSRWGEFQRLLLFDAALFDQVLRLGPVAYRCHSVAEKKTPVQTIGLTLARRESLRRCANLPGMLNFSRPPKANCD